MNTSNLNLSAALNADLHCHSVVSDGTLTPQELAARAQRNHVALWSLTDHDEVGGIAAAREAALALGLPFLAGVEISVSWQDKTIHIVGLGIDEQHPELIAGLQKTRGGREARAREIARQLEVAGIPNTFEGALSHVGNPDLISRSHFARHLVEIGVCENVPEVFRRYLTEGKPGYVPHEWATLQNAVQWIRNAAGIAIIAHPARYGLSPALERMLFAEFKRAGGQGVEVTTSAHTAPEIEHFAQVALDWDLFGSRGSDFHCPTESRIDLGTLPPLPNALTPVWQALAHRISHP